MIKTVLSFDVSTTTIGICKLSYGDDGYVHMDHIEDYKPNKKGDLLERLVETKAYILYLIKKFKPDEIAIEKFIEYMKASNSKTILLLAIFNQTIALACYEELGKLPHIMNVNSVRALIKIPNAIGRLSKEDVPKALEYHLGIKWEFLYTKPKKSKKSRIIKEPKIMPESYDRADACAVGLAYIFSQRPKIKKVRVSKKKK